MKRIVLITLILALPLVSALEFAEVRDAFDSRPGTPFMLETGPPKSGLFSGNFTDVSRVNFTNGNFWGLAGNNHATVAFWINITSLQNSAALAAMEGTCTASDCTIFVGVNSAGRLWALWWPDNIACAGRDALGTTTLETNVWYHAAFVYNRVGGSGMEFYKNGTLENSAFTDSGNLCGTANTQNSLGYIKKDNTAHCTCLIDNLYVYNRSLTAGEIGTLAGLGEPSNTSLAAVYDFEGNFTGGIPPGTPVLSSVLDADGQGATLTWTTPTGSIDGYVLTRGLAGATTYTFNGSTNTYHVWLLTRPSTFSVHAFNANASGPESNVITLTATDRKLFGENSSLSSDLTGQQLSQGWFGSPDFIEAAFITLGLVFVMIVTGGSAYYLGAWGGVGFGFVASALCYLFGWWPEWLLIFIVVALTGVGIIFYNRTGEA